MQQQSHVCYAIFLEFLFAMKFFHLIMWIWWCFRLPYLRYDYPSSIFHFFLSFFMNFILMKGILSVLERKGSIRLHSIMKSIVCNKVVILIVSAYDGSWWILKCLKVFQRVVWTPRYPQHLFTWYDSGSCPPSHNTFGHMKWFRHYSLCQYE